MKPYYDFDPFNLPEDLLHAIGLVTAAAAHTEGIVESAIAGIAKLDIEYGHSFTTHMAMPLRLDVLRSVAEITIDDLDDLDLLDEIISEIETVFKKRNAAVHHSWCVEVHTKKTSTVKLTARGSVQQDVTERTSENLIEDAVQIYDAGLSLFKFLKTKQFYPTIPSSPRPRAHKTKAARKERRKLLGKS